MLEKCFYQHLPSLLPATDCSNDGDDDFRRLEHLSACKISKIIQNQHFARWILPHLPLKLTVPIFKLAIANYFYIGQNGSLSTQERSYQALLQLVLHWPSKTLVLQDVMPSLPPTDRFDLKQLENEAIDNIKSTFEHFYRQLLQRLSKVLSKNKDNIASHSEIICGPLQNIDSTGYYVPGSYDLRLGKQIPPFTQCKLVYSNNNKRGYHDILNSKKHITNFRRSSINDQEPDIKELSDHLTLNRTEFLELHWDGLDENNLNTICESLPHLIGLRLQQKDLYKINTIRNLTSLNNLKQLDLSGINLRGKLGPLCKFAKGFDYLRLRDAKLQSEDLDVLAISPHPSTLRQLDLSCNELGHHDDAKSLTLLCQKLEKIQILELEYCELHLWQERSIADLVNCLRILPCLTLLFMNNNMFFSNVLVIHIPFLSTNKSLRYISLSIPDDLSYDQSVKNNFKT
ncbi:unnamed protein product, partial [Meganyctiphanes norvegica]